MNNRWSTQFRTWFELVFSVWKTETYLSPHDHGQAKGIVVLLRGELIERKWIEKENELLFVKQTIMKAPSINIISSNDIHDVRATKTSYTIHLYYPVPILDKINVFEKRTS